MAAISRRLVTDARRCYALLCVAMRCYALLRRHGPGGAVDSHGGASVHSLLLPACHRPAAVRVVRAHHESAGQGDPARRRSLGRAASVPLQPVDRTSRRLHSTPHREVSDTRPIGDTRPR